MGRKHYQAEQIISMLREAEVLQRFMDMAGQADTVDSLSLILLIAIKTNHA